MSIKTGQAQGKAHERGVVGATWRLRMISSELSHWSTIARFPDITVADRIGANRPSTLERQPGLLRFSPPRSLTWAVSA
jgi:hypothetical protein